MMFVIATEKLLLVVGSKLSEAASTRFVTDVVLPAVMVSVNCADTPFASDAKLHDTGPFEPGSGVLHDAVGPVSCVSPLKTVFGGSVSVHPGFTAVSGPLLLIVIV